MRYAQLKRGNAVITDLDFYDLLLRGDKSKDVRLLGGDFLSKTEAKRKLETNEINALTPDINWSHGVIERQDSKTLSTELVSFDLGKLVLDGDDSQNLEVAAGDVVTIFSQGDIRVPAEQRVQMIRLEGEIKAAGVYAAKPGETFGQLIQRAGGLTPRAYLFASEFNRESAREDQKKRLNQYTDELDREAKRVLTDSAGAGTVLKHEPPVGASHHGAFAGGATEWPGCVEHCGRAATISHN